MVQILPPLFFLKREGEMDNFIILILTHFVSDWFFQPTEWAIKKRENEVHRVLHSIQYALIFLPVLYFLNISLLWIIYLSVTHFIIDSYIPVSLWHKYYHAIFSKAKTPSFVSIVDDQIIHILLLIPMVL